MFLGRMIMNKICMILLGVVLMVMVILVVFV